MRSLVVTRSLAALAGVALIAGCTAKHSPDPGPTITPSPSPSPSMDAQEAAAPALFLLAGYVPKGYRPKPVESGYHSAADTSGQTLREKLTGRHLLQIACSGDGAVSAVVGKAAARRIACGQTVSLPLNGPLDVTIAGRAGNTGVVAWRVLPHI